MLKPKISLSHPTGNPFARNAALAIEQIDSLQDIITTIAYNPHHPWATSLRWLPSQLSTFLDRELDRRSWTSPTSRPIQTHPWREILRVALIRLKLGQYLQFDHWDLDAWVATCLDRQVAQQHLQGLDAVYAYEDAAATTFAAAKQAHVYCFYDLPIAFYRTSQKILTTEAELFPEFKPVLQVIDEPAWKIQRKEQELSLADHIFVASSFTAESLLEVGVESNKISVIPYGAPIDYFRPQPKPDQLFRALFVGLIGPRKGVHYLLQAWRDLNLSDAELCLVGTDQFPDRWLHQWNQRVRHVASVPHQALGQYYSMANIFVFPSLVEGFGLVLLEAMACGIPVITTPHTAGPDIITDGVEGFIIPVRDVEALKQKLAWCYQHPRQLAEMGQAARQKAEQLTWDRYRQRLSNRILELLEDAAVQKNPI